jgi:hypothetical protein
MICYDSSAMAGTPPSSAGSARIGPRARAVSQVGWAALLAALVLLSGLEIHPGGEAHDSIAALAGGHEDLYFPSASHPAARPHAEEARAAPRPPCAACLNRLQGSGAHFASAASLSTPLAAQPLPSAAALTPLRKSLRPDGARAPPSA